jgi:hypothetical protein
MVTEIHNSLDITKIFYLDQTSFCVSYCCSKGNKVGSSLFILIVIYKRRLKNYEELLSLWGSMKKNMCYMKY